MARIGKIPLGFMIIGVLKLLSALLLFCASLGIYHYLNADMRAVMEHLTHRLHLDPQNHLINLVLIQVAGFSHGQLQAIGGATFLYALLYLAEGVGILRGYHWAEYLIILATGLLLPVEVYELTLKVTQLKLVVLCVNAAMVIYLIYQLYRERR